MFGDDVRRMAVSPDGEVLAATSNDLPVGLWDARTGEHLWSIGGDGLTGFVSDIGWHPDGDALALAVNPLDGADGTDAATVVVDRSGNVLSRLVEPSGVFLNSASFTGDGASVMASRVSNRNDPEEAGLVVWDWRGERVRRVLRSRPLDLEPERDGTSLVAVHQIEGSAEVWDLADGAKTATFRSSGSIYAVAFRPDGLQVAFAGADGTVGLGDPRTGATQLVLRGHEASVSNLGYSPDGTRVASVGTDGVLRVWTLDLDELIRLAEDRITRRLSEDECRRWLHLDACPDR